ncbi:MAG TPA: cell wall-active antibiotics response protein LiaF [Bacillales bacterium]|nr:cell wall-active antibiotics response protein LiaF [Bacillales bacterium]
MKRRSAGHVMAALCLIGLGILLLLVNTQFISLEISEAIILLYPFLLFVWGGWLFILRLFSRGRRGSLFWGLFLLLFGGLLSLNRFGWIDFTFSMIWQLWPYLLVYFGVKMMAGSRLHVTVKTSGKKHAKQTSAWHIVSDVTFNEDNWLVEPIYRSTGVADYDFDFTRAFIQEKETPIELRGWVGDVKVIIPEDVEFSVDAKAAVGEIKVGDRTEEGLLKQFHFQTSGYEEAERKLTFAFDFKVLDLRIDRV